MELADMSSQSAAASASVPSGSYWSCLCFLAHQSVLPLAGKSAAHTTRKKVCDL